MRDLESELRRSEGLDTIDAWRDFAQSLLTPQPCVLHRNNEISALYAWVYLRHPSLFKWAGMAAFASNHARLIMLPYKLGQVRHGYVDLEGYGQRWSRLAVDDLETIRETNNAIFHDIFWAHLVYDGSRDGLERLERLLAGTTWEAMLDGFRLIEAGRGLLALEDQHVEEEAIGLIWEGNTRLLWHEQSEVVQPRFERLTGSFARFFSLGASLSFRSHGVRGIFAISASFYLYMTLRHPHRLLAQRSLPRVNRLPQRWLWAESVLVPSFRSHEQRGDRVAEKMKQLVKLAATESEEAPCDLGTDD